MSLKSFALLLSAVVVGPAPPTIVRADDGSLINTLTGTKPNDLKDQLAKGLRAYRPEDHKFLHHVADLVKADRLPLDLVKSTFIYVRARRDEPYLVPYFERVLRIRAAKAGLTI